MHANTLTQSIFEYRRPEKRSTNRFTPATAVKHAKKIETKNENVSSEKPVFGLKSKDRAEVQKGGRKVDQIAQKA